MNQTKEASFSSVTWEKRFFRWFHFLLYRDNPYPPLRGPPSPWEKASHFPNSSQWHKDRKQVSTEERAPSSGRGRPACGPGIGRRRRVVRLAAFAGRRQRTVSHPNGAASASYPPLPPFQRKGVTASANATSVSWHIRVRLEPLEPLEPWAT